MNICTESEQKKFDCSIYLIVSLIVFIINFSVMPRENDKLVLSNDQWLADVDRLLDPMSCSEPKDFIIWDRITEFVTSREICGKEIQDYWTTRNRYNVRIKPMVMFEFEQLQELFNVDRSTSCFEIPSREKEHSIVSIKLMSSYTANTNLSGTSDIDIGIIVNEMTKTKVQGVEQLLNARGYQFSRLINGYYCYNKIITNDHGEVIEIELKIRDYDQQTKDMIRLHDYLDNECEEKQKMIYTYLKYKFMLYRDIFPGAYQLLKMLFYNIALLKINPMCKKFITNI